VTKVCAPEHGVDAPGYSEAMELIGLIIAGIIVGFLGKFIAPGDKDNTPVWLTILCGVGGVLIGSAIYTASAGTEALGSTGLGGLSRSSAQRSW
jgi:uncharacterized membrane protein YeaQ/YmgE (transglycosylase-associated protein family)